MSHKKLRIEKNCLNCGHEVEERFCSQCGQENLEIKDSTLHLIIHYVQDLFHYDGKLWHTMKSLVTKPGLVAKEYMEGKRQRYLEPIRFYVFASTIFFLMFYVYIGDKPLTTSEAPATNYTKRLYNLKKEKSFLQGTADTAHANALISTVINISGIDTTFELGDSSVTRIDIDLRDSLREDEEQMGWLEKIFEERSQMWLEEVNEKYEGDANKASRVVGDKIKHSLPQLFFLSLPFFAFFLWLMYGRSKRKPYVEHFVFSVYHYAYLFIVMFLCYLISTLFNIPDGSEDDPSDMWLNLIVIFYPLIYLFLSMRRYYEDRWFFLSLKFIVLSALLVTTMIGLFVIFLVFAFFF